MNEGIGILIVFVILLALLHFPIYVWYRIRRNSDWPPSPVTAFLLSFFPSPIGGILYVHGLLGAVPCLVTLLVIFSEVPGGEAERTMLGASVLAMAVLSSGSALLQCVLRRRRVTGKATDQIEATNGKVA